MKEGEVIDLRRRMEELSAVEKATTKKISRLKVNLGREVVARLSQEEEVVQLGGLKKKGSEMLKRNSQLQQKESALLAAQQEFEKM